MPHDYQSLPSPPTGVDMRFNPETQQSCAFALNLNFSRFPIGARYGLEPMEYVSGGSWITQLRARVVQIYVLECRHNRYICSIRLGTPGADTRPWFDVMLPNGQFIAAFDLAQYGYRTDYDEGDFHDFSMAFFPQVEFASSRSLYITAPDGEMLKYAPEENEKVLQRLVMENGPLAAESSYLAAPPRCKIITNHLNHMFWGGFDRGTKITCADPIPQLDPRSEFYIPEDMIDQQDRFSYQVSPQAFIWSDGLTPHKAASFQFIELVDEYPITAMVSFRGRLVIFTKRSIWSMTGERSADFRPHRLVNGVGCVARHSVREAGGMLFFLADDGVYAFDGSNALKVSSPLDPLFDGDATRIRVPFGYPGLQLFPSPSIARNFIESASAGVFWPEHQYWVALPICENGADPDEVWRGGPVGRVILVYDWINRTWSLFSLNDVKIANVTRAAGVMAFAQGPSSEIMYVGTNVGTYRYQTGNLYDIWTQVSSAGTNDTKKAIPLMWVSQRYGQREWTDKHWEKFRLALKSWGLGASNQDHQIKFWFQSSNTPFVSPPITGWSSIRDESDSFVEQVEPHPRPKRDSQDIEFWGEFKYGTPGTGGDGVLYHPNDVFVEERGLNLDSKWIQVGMSEQNPAGSRLGIIGLGVDVKTAEGD